MNTALAALLVKASAILAVAAIAALMLQKSSAARRHFVWSAAMSSVLVLALLQLVVPPIMVPVAEQSPLALLAFASNNAAPEGQPVLPQTNNVSLPRGVTGTTSVLTRVNASASTVQPPEVSGAGSTASSATDMSPVQDVSPPSATPDHASALPKSNQSAAQQLQTLFLIVWFSGALFILLRIAVAHVRMRGILRESQVVSDVALRAALERAKVRLDVPTHIQIGVHNSISAPCTTGVRAPVILLPSSCTEWNDARKQAVFTHELAHISRGDSRAQLVAGFACALFWFHPAFWLAARLLRAEGERAADDCVINSGMHAVEYADHLLAIASASTTRGHIPMAALAMARSTQLESRFRAMLNSRQSRTAVTRRTQRLIAAATLLALVPFAALEARVQPPVVRPAQPPVSPAARPSVVSPARSPEARVSQPSVARPTQPPVAPVVQPSVSRAAQPPVVRAAAVAPSIAPPSAAVAAPVIPPTVAPSVAPPASVAPRVTPAVPTTPAIAAPAVVMPRVRPPTSSPPPDTVYEFTVDATPGESLYVNIPVGGNVIVHGWDSNTAKVRANIGGSAWRETKVYVRREARGVQVIAALQGGREMTVDAVRNGKPERIMLRSPLQMQPEQGHIPTTVDNEFEIWVPRNTRVKLTSPIGKLTLLDMDGGDDAAQQYMTVNAGAAHAPSIRNSESSLRDLARR